MSKMYIPRRVIEYMLKPKYMRDGCEVEFVEEEFNGKSLHRWIIDNIIVWSAVPTKKGSEE